MNPEYWLTNTKDVSDWRIANLPDSGLCPILKMKPTRWTCDHDHYDLKVRGMISQQANTWEGYIVKYFQKYCANYTQLSLTEALRNLTEYLESSYWLDNKLHHRGIEDMRKFLERCTKPTIVRRAKEDLNLNLDENLLKEDLVEIYLIDYIKKCEETVWK